MANVKDLYARISATADGFNKTMDGVESKTRSVAKSISSQNSILSKSLNGVGKASSTFKNVGSNLQSVSGKAGEIGSKFNTSITKPAGVAATAIGGMVGALGFKRLMGMDAAQAKLKGLGYSGKEVEGISKQVTTAIEGSMTTMAEGTDIAAGGLASGVQEGKELEKYIKLVGDAAVGSGRPVNEMSMIFARIQGSGKVMTEELNMIEDGMPGFSKAMAEDMGVPLDEFREKVTNGEVSSEQFMETMDSFAGKMSGAYANSFEGMAKNTMAFVGQIGEKLLGGAFEKSKKSLNEFLGWISSPEVQNGATQLGEKVGAAFNVIINAVSGAVKWFAGLPSPVLKIAGALGMLLVAVGPVLTMFSKVTGVIGGMFSTFGSLLGLLAGLGPVGLIIMGVVAALAALGTAFYIAYQKSETFRNFINGIGRMIGGAINWIKQFGQAIGALFGGDQKEGTSILKRLGFNEQQISALQEMVGRIKNTFTTMGQTLAVVFGRIGKTWQSVVQAFQSAAPLFQLAFQNILGIITPLITMIGNQIKIVFNAIVGIVQGALQMIQGIVQIFSGLIQGDFGLMWQGVKNVFMGAINVLWSLVKGLFFLLVNTITGLGGMLIGAFKAIFNTFKPIVMAVWNGIKIATMYVWNGIVNAVVTSISTLKLRAMQILNALKFAITAIWNGIKFVSVAVWNGIKWAVINAANLIKSGAIATFNAFKAAITAIWNGIKYVSTAVWNGIKNAVLFVARTIKSGAIATFNLFKASIIAIWNTIKVVTSSVWNWIKNRVIALVTTLKNTSLAVFRALRASMTAIWNGIKAVTSAVWNWIKNRVIALARTLRSTVVAVFNALRSTITAIWNGIKAITSAVWNWIKNKVIALARTLRSTVVAVFNALRSRITAIWNGIKSITSAVWNWIKNKVIALARTLRSTVVNVFNAFKNTISNIWNSIKNTTSRIWNAVKSTVINLATGLKNTVVSRFNTLKNAVSGIWGKVKSTAINMWQGIKDKITGFATGIKDGVVGTFNKMKDSLKSVIGKIKGFVQDMVDKVKGGLNKLIDGVNWVGDKLGMGEIDHVKMHTGTSSGGSVTRNGKLSKDVMATVGDKGKGNGPGGFRHETVIPPRGKPFITPNTDTLMPAQKGTQIMNGAQTHAMLSSGTYAFAKGTGVAGGKKPKKAKKGDSIFGDIVEGGKALGGKILDGGKAVVDKTLSGVKKGKDWLGDKVQDVMDFIDKPEKLLEHVLKGFGVGFDLEQNTIPADMMAGMFKKLKQATIDKFKSWFEESGEGEGGWVDISKGINFPFSPNGRAPGYPFNSPHYGVDLNYVNEKLYSTHSGKATAIPDDGSGFGNHMSIKNGALEIIYGHMSKLAWKGTKDVHPGSYLGVSGNTGRSSGPHLHYEMRKNGKPIDPMPFLKKQSKGGGKKKPSAWGSTIDKAAKKMGVKLSASQRKGIIAQIARESNGDAGVTQGNIGDINNRRGTPAQGLLQYVPSTFKSYATKGHKNIKSGYDQLLAFFNNSNWARDLAYGKSGWGPTGANRGYADGGIINAPEMAWLAEGGFSESIISHDPKNRVRSKAIHDKTGKMLGVDDDAVILRDILDAINSGNNLQSVANKYAKQTARKDTNVYLNGKKMTKEINGINGALMSGKDYNIGNYGG